MIEMLAVIAIIGVLSIDGIKSYDMARRQIALSKLSDAMNFTTLSLLDDYPIYERLRQDDGKFTAEKDETGFQNGINATELFANAYGIKYSRTKDGKKGISWGSDIHFIVGIDNYEQFSVVVKVVGVSPDSDSDNRIMRSVVERIRDVIKNNKELRSRVKILINEGSSCINGGMKDENDALFESFLQEKCWRYNTVLILRY